MHGLNQIAHLNQEAVREYRERAQSALDAKEEAPIYTIEDIEEARQEAFEQGREEGADAGQDDAWAAGYEDGHNAGYDAAVEDLSGPAPLLDRLISGGIETLEPFVAHYDAALKALVFEQGAVTVYLHNEG